MRNRVLCFASLLLVGCSAGSLNATPPENGNDLIGGVTDNGDPSVLILIAQLPGSSQGHFCTASVIGPTTLITAAHCVSPDVIGAGLVFTAYTGNDFFNDRGQALAVDHVDWDHAFNINNLSAGHDLGAVFLSSPTGLAPLPVNRSSSITSMVGQPLRVVGYGNNDGRNATGLGLKRFLDTRLDSVDSLLVRMSNNGTGSCQGDSGGPEFMRFNGTEAIVGTSSFSTTGCPGGGSYTRVDSYLSTIDGWLRGQNSGECGTVWRTGGAIGAEYQRLGGCGSFLGAPTTNENDTACEGGKYNGFENGAITWSPSAGAHETHGGIRAKWQEMGFECGLLGLPTSDESNSACGGGRYNNFERGAILWSPATGAHNSYGPIRDRWLQLGYECQYLGFPTSDIYAFNGGSKCDFQGGSITVAANGAVTDEHKACTSASQCKPGGACTASLCQ